MAREEALRKIEAEIEAAKLMLEDLRKRKDPAWRDALKQLAALQTQKVLLMENAQSPSQAPTAAFSNVDRPNLMSDLKELARALRDAEPFDSEVIMLPPLRTSEIEIESPLFTNVYMRAEYRSLLLRIQEQGCETSLVICGTPGIGKSTFVVPLMSALAKKHRMIYYRFHASRFQQDAAVVFDFRDAARDNIRVDFALGPYEMERLKTVLGSAGTMVLCDGVAPSAAYDGSGTMPDLSGNKTAIIVMTSPNQENWHQFTKGGATMLYLNPWKFKELEECRVKLYPSVTPAMARERFRVYGGVIRDVLASPTRVFTELTKTLGLEHVRLLGNLRNLGSRSDVCHTLVHIRATANFQLDRFVFASPEVGKLVHKIVFEEAQHQVQTLMHGAAGYKGVAGFRGMVFEQHGHLVVPAGVVVQMRQLGAAGKRQRPLGGGSAEQLSSRPKLESEMEKKGDGSMEEREVEDNLSHHWGPDVEDPAPQEGEEREGGEEGEKGVEGEEGQQGQSIAGAVHHQFAGMQLGDGSGQHQGRGVEVRLERVKHQWDEPDLDLEPLMEGGGGFYLQPPTANNPSWDAVYVSGSDRLILQYTVSSRHGVRARPLEDLLRRMGRAAGNVRLVFVVPSEPAELYNTFQAQPLLKTDGKVMKRIPVALQGLQQSLMRLPLSTSTPNSRGSNGGGAGAIPPCGDGS